MKPHKWAKEIKAWADGAEIEFRFKDHLGQSWSDWLPATKPNFDAENAQYRIKPTPKKPQYLYVTDGVNGVEFHREKQFQANPAQWNIGKIKLEQDDD